MCHPISEEAFPLFQYTGGNVSYNLILTVKKELYYLMKEIRFSEEVSFSKWFYSLTSVHEIN